MRYPECSLLEYLKSVGELKLYYCRTAISSYMQSKPDASFHFLVVFNGITINISRNNRYKNNKTSYLCKSFFGILT